MSATHFLSIDAFELDVYEHLIQRGIELKRLRAAGERYEPLRGRSLGMMFDQPSTRTRVGFEVGMTQLGGHALFLSQAETQLGRGEPVDDAARVLSQMLDVVMIRTPDQSTIEEFAGAASIPVINAMSSEQHPCQMLADMMTYYELRGAIGGAKVAFIGDVFNLCRSYIMAANVFGFDLTVACPAGYEPDADFMASHGQRTTLTRSPAEAVRDVDLVVTDVWASMGHEQEHWERMRAFQGFQVDEALLDQAREDVLFMHCLPAHRGEEVSTTLPDDPRSVVFEEAGNRLHSQKALLEYVLLGA